MSAGAVAEERLNSRTGPGWGLEGKSKVQGVGEAVDAQHVASCKSRCGGKWLEMEGERAVESGACKQSEDLALRRRVNESPRSSDTDSDSGGRSRGLGGGGCTRQWQEEAMIARLQALLPRELVGASNTLPGSQSEAAGGGGGGAGGVEEVFEARKACGHQREGVDSPRFALTAQGLMTVLLGFSAAYIFTFLLTAPRSWNTGEGAPKLDCVLVLARMSAPLQGVRPVLAFLGMFLCIVAGAWFNDAHMWRRKSSPAKPCAHCEGLKRSRSMVEEADERALKAQRAKQQFMAYVFHNIRVPFNAIVLGLGHMRATGSGVSQLAADPDRVDLLQMMLDCAETMTSVLDDVTDMGQWEDGRIELTNDEFDLLAVIKFLSWGLKDLLDQKQIQFHMQIDPLAKSYLAAHHVVADKHRVVQTLGNFLSNAMKFTPAGGRVELGVKCVEVMEEQDWAVTSSPALLAERSAFPLSEGSELQLSLSETSSAELAAASSTSPGTPPVQRPPDLKYKVARLQISVRDTGIGMSQEDQAKLFEPYSFVSSGWVQKAGVSGLGLSMAKRFVEQVGGHIGVASKEGSGSTFHFTIPFPLIPVDGRLEKECPSAGASRDSGDTAFRPKGLSDQEEEARFKENLKAFKGRTSKSAASYQFQGTGNTSWKRKVLLVEDTAINRIVLRKVLENLNLLVEEAENGKIAVDLAQQGRKYDLILMDKEMPVMDGHEATRQLRMMGVKTPIIALTGNSLQSDRKLFLEAGVDDFQTKPLSRDKLVQLLARYGVESSCA